MMFRPTMLQASRCLALSTLACLILLVTIPCVDAATFQVIGEGGGVAAVSADGSVVVGTSYSLGRSGFEAFRWSEEDGLIGLGFLNATEVRSGATDVSGDGHTVVGWSDSAHSQQNAFRWTEERGIEPLFIDAYSEAFAVSYDGSVIVGHGSFGVEEKPNSFVWTEAKRELLAEFSVARDVSPDGSVVVGSYTSTRPDFGFLAFRWKKETGLTLLDGLAPNPDLRVDRALAISADGSYVVGSGAVLLDPLTLEHAVRWNEQGVVEDLGVLPGTDESVALAVSADGSVIVGRSGSLNPFIWDADNGMRALQRVLETDYDLADELAGWQVLGVSDISDDGRVIVGGARNPQGAVVMYRVVLDSATILSDLTNNGFVDFEDLTVLLANWNKQVGVAEGNLVNAGTTPVNFEDLTVLLADWTGPGPAGSPEAALDTEAVPEPSSLLLALLATLGLSFGWRRRRAA